MSVALQNAFEQDDIVNDDYMEPEPAAPQIAPADEIPQIAQESERGQVSLNDL